MSLSLREQLLKAGLVTEKQARKAGRETSQQQHQRKKGAQPSPQHASASDQARAAKLARDQALNRQRQEQAAARARVAELRQLIEQHRLPPVESDDYFSFVDGTKVRRIPVTPALRERLVRGTAVIARCGGRYDLLPTETAPRILERDPAAIVTSPQTGSPAAERPDDDPYKDFVVPDDLTW